MAQFEAHQWNINVGVLGHVDSGKTSLCQSLSSVASTACFDKNPQSQERGITLDLGFSSFSLKTPERFRTGDAPEEVQITLVDCPGHASLIRTIIGGAHIIDLMLLVVDAVKGVQTQTAECLVIGELTCQRMIVVLNKADLVTEAALTKMTKKLVATLDSTAFKGCPVVPVAAHPTEGEPRGLAELVTVLSDRLPTPERSSMGNFLFAADHCFTIRGQGTVLTGTVLQGSIAVNQTVEIPSLKVNRKIKSMQVFRKPTSVIQVGDRAGICLTQVDPVAFERGVLCSPGSVPLYFAVISRVHKIRFFKQPVVSSNQGRFHLSIGHETVMAKITLFAASEDDTIAAAQFNFDREYTFLEELSDKAASYALIEFENGVHVPERSLLIGSRLDADLNANMCRLAFHGSVVHGFKEKQYATTDLAQLKVFKLKSKVGVVDRGASRYEVILRSLFTKESRLDPFLGLRVVLSTGETGVLEGTFGASGKCKLRMIDELKDATWERLSVNTKGKKGVRPSGDSNLEPISAHLRFKKFIFDPKHKLHPL